MDVTQWHQDTLRSKAIDFVIVFLVVVGVASLLGYTYQSIGPAAVTAIVTVWKKHSRRTHTTKTGD